jgi:hypothetical protein
MSSRIDPLIKDCQQMLMTIKEGNELDRRVALNRLLSRTAHSHNIVRMARDSLGLVTTLVDMMTRESGLELLYAVSIFRNLCGDQVLPAPEKYANVIPMANSRLHIMPLLVKLVNENQGDIRLAALRSIVRIAAPRCSKLIVASELDLMSSVVDIIRSPTVDQDTVMHAIWILWKLAESDECSLLVATTGVCIDLIRYISNAEGYPNTLNTGGNNIEFNTLMAIFLLASSETSRHYLKASGAISILGPMMLFDTLYGLMASLSYVFLVGHYDADPLNQMTESGLYAIHRVIETFENVVLNKSGTGYQAGVFLILPMIHAIHELSVSDANKHYIAVPRIRDLLVKIIRDVKYKELEAYSFMDEHSIDLRMQGADVAMKCLLQLSFINEDNGVLCSDAGFIPESSQIKQVLLDYDELLHINTTEVNNILIGRLSSRKQAPISFGEVDTNNTVAFRKQVMISYHWNPKAKPTLVASFATVLRAHGFDVWRDIEGSAHLSALSGSSSGLLTEAIEHSHTVIIFVSREYKMSGSCRAEATYADQLRKKGFLRIVFVMMQVDYTMTSAERVDGYLANMIGNSTCQPLWDIAQLESTADAIGAELRRRNINAQEYMR